MKSCGLSLTALAARPIWRTARPVSSAARLMLGSGGAAEVVGRCRHHLRAVGELVDGAAFGAQALGGGADVVGHGRHAGARLLQRFQRVARVRRPTAGSAARAGSSRFCRVASSRWVRALTLPAAWPMLPSAWVMRCWFSSPSSWLMRRVASSTWARMLGACSAMRPKGEGLSVRRGRPLGPGAAGAGAGWRRPAAHGPGR